MERTPGAGDGVAGAARAPLIAAGTAGATGAGDGAAGAPLIAAAAPPAVEQGAAANGMIPKPVKSSGRKKSDAWNHFEKPVLQEDGTQTTKCKYCPQTYVCGSQGYGTTNLNKHILVCEGNPGNKKKGRQSILAFTSGKGKEVALSSWRFDQDRCRAALADMLVIDELPFRFVEAEGFRKLMAACCPQFIVPSRNTSTRDVYKLFMREKKKLQAMFAANSVRVSLTTDTWTSNQQISYMCLTAHYIDEQWNLQKRIIAFCQIHGHKGDDIGASIEYCLTDWGIDKVMCITVDNASANELAVNHIRRKLAGTNILGGRLMHMRCIAHIINLIVSDGIGMLGASVERVRAAVKFVKQSPSRVSRFKSCVAAAGINSKALLCQDVPTRWNSTFLMLRAACTLEAAFERYDVEDESFRHELQTKPRRGSNEPLGMLCDEDWRTVKSFMSFLKHFYDLTCRVSGSSYVTCNTFLDEVANTLELIRKGQSAENNFDMIAMADKMRVKFDKYWTETAKLNLIVFLAAIFDPRSKLQFVEHAVNVMYPPPVAVMLYRSINTTLIELFAEYVKLFSIIDTSELPSQVQASPVVVVVEQPSKNLFRASFNKRLKSSNNDIVKTELDKYLNEALEDDADDDSFSLLGWWKSNCHRFPMLSRIAKDILAIPISTVSSESAFSTGGRVLHDFRSSLTPRLVEALVCTQDWVRGSNAAMTLEQDLKDLEKFENEFKEFGLGEAC